MDSMLIPFLILLNIGQLLGILFFLDILSAKKRFLAFFTINEIIWFVMWRVFGQSTTNTISNPLGGLLFLAVLLWYGLGVLGGCSLMYWTAKIFTSIYAKKTWEGIRRLMIVLTFIASFPAAFYLFFMMAD